MTPELRKALSSITTKAELHEAWDYLKQLNSMIKQDAVREVVATGAIYVGAKVMFQGRHGSVVRGTVEKVNRTTVTVRDAALHNLWRVSITLVQQDMSGKCEILTGASTGA